jgi:hypothetical protein
VKVTNGVEHDHMLGAGALAGGATGDPPGSAVIAAAAGERPSGPRSNDRVADTGAISAQDDCACPEGCLDAISGGGPNSLNSLIDAGILDSRGTERAPAAPAQAAGDVAQPDVPTSGRVFDVYVEPGLLDSIRPSLDLYAADLRAEGYQVTIAEFAGAAEQLRGELQGRWTQDGLEGALFVGDLPFVEFASADSFSGSSFLTEYPHDLFFMDLDGQYVLNQQGADFHTGDVGPEIYVSRLTAGNLGGVTGQGEAELIDAYFDKVHDVRTGDLSYEDRGLMFLDDDWQFNFQGSLSSLYGQVDELRDPALTTRDAYLDLLSQNAESLFEAIHSAPTFHSISGIDGGIVNSSEIPGIDPQVGFLNMFNCSSADFAVNNHLIGAYLFGSDAIVNAIGSA